MYIILIIILLLPNILNKIKIYIIYIINLFHSLFYLILFDSHLIKILKLSSIIYFYNIYFKYFIYLFTYKFLNWFFFFFMNNIIISQFNELIDDLNLNKPLIILLKLNHLKML